MDLESECSVVESAEDNEAITTPDKLANGSGFVVDDDKLLENDKGKEIEVTESMNSLVNSVSALGTTKKGYGLKKWRRIKREVNTDDGDLDSLFGQGQILRTASLPLLLRRQRYEKPVVVVGCACDKNGIRSLSGKNLVQQGKGGWIESSKKPRGDMVKIEKENAHSSMESDSISSNFVFMQGTNFAMSNGRQSGKSMNEDGGNSDEDQGREPQFSEELQAGDYDRKETGEFEYVSEADLAAGLSWQAKGEKSENYGSSSDQDTLVESILSLQSVQEVLEKEVQKLKDTGKADISVFDDCYLSLKTPYVSPEVHEQCSSNPLQFGESGQGSPHSFEIQLTSLKQSVHSLESKLEEARVMLKTKEDNIVELEATLDNNKFTKEESGSIIGLGFRQEKYGEMEIELEGLFRQKIEAEVQYLAISRTIQKLRVAAMEVLEEQKTLALDQAQMLKKLGYAEGKAAMLKRQAEKLESYCEDVIGADEVRIFKSTLYFFIQLTLLLIILGLFKFSSLDPGMAPT